MSRPPEAARQLGPVGQQAVSASESSPTPTVTAGQGFVLAAEEEEVWDRSPTMSEALPLHSSPTDPPGLFPRPLASLRCPWGLCQEEEAHLRLGAGRGVVGAGHRGEEGAPAGVEAGSNTGTPDPVRHSRHVAGSCTAWEGGTRELRYTQ